MQRQTIVLGFIGALLLPVALLAADKPKLKPVPAPVIQKLGWLAGSWRMEKGGRVRDEQWMAPAGGAMLGMARTVAKGVTVEFEFLQIREGPGGDLYYVARASGQPEATYRGTSATAAAVVFENSEHDFPQKISYELQPDGSLLATLEGPGPDGQPKRVESALRRVQP